MNRHEATFEDGFLMGLAQGHALAEAVADALAPCREADGASVVARVIRRIGRELDANGGVRVSSDAEVIETALAADGLGESG